MMSMLRLSNIANFLSDEHDLSEIVQYLAMHTCRDEQICRIYIAQIKPDLKLEHLASFGFEKEMVDANQVFKLDSDPVLTQTIRSSTVIIRARDEEYKKDFERITGNALNDLDTWKSTVLFPLLPNFFVAISFQVEIRDDKENREYFELFRSILNMYLHLHQDNHAKAFNQTSKKSDSSFGEKLTERQETILSKIRQGMTNISIANQLGYSESLIRQETMAIYQKLGVTGRRDIHFTINNSAN